MARARVNRELELSRRGFLVTTGGALMGMAALGLVDQAAAGQRRPGRDGGGLRTAYIES